MRDDDPRQTLAAMLREVGAAHYEAFAVEGEDPEWPLWYADHLRENVVDVLDEDLTRSDIATLLSEAAAAHAGASERDWPEFYAEYLLDRDT